MKSKEIVDREIFISSYSFAYGNLTLGSYEGTLCLCDWSYRKMRDQIDKRIQKGLNAHYIEEETPILRAAKVQLEEYMKGDRLSFDIPLTLVGTDFQKQVWSELLTIPYGKTLSYLELSKSIGNIQAIRAVASANGANALSIFIPCHRVIASNGKMQGYAGGVETKESLLRLEGAISCSQLQLFEI